MPTYQFFYARVSSADQNLDRQLAEAESLKIPPERIFTDKSSGKDFVRENYERLLSVLREGDTVYISSLDRLGRNYRETSDAWEYITKSIGAKIRVLDMPILNTESDDITAELINDIVMKLLAYIAEKELRGIHARQRAGIEAAKKRGVYRGRAPVKFDRQKFLQLYIEVQNHDRTIRSAASRLGVSVSTFGRLRKEYESKTGRWSPSASEI
ncbi:MAG: recombinase family protein [Candidatus Cryptobacteroides sp.]